MKDLLNELSEKFVFNPPKTGSWGYFNPKDKKDDYDGDNPDGGGDGPVGESNTTSNIDGGEGPQRTPYAFDDKGKKGVEKRLSNIKSGGGHEYTIVGDIYESIEYSIQDIEEQVNEISYTSYKKDDERTDRQKVNQTLISVYRKLKEVENLLDINIKLKNERNLHSEMWPKASPKKLQMIDRKINTIKRKAKKMH